MNFHFNEWLIEKIYNLKSTYGDFDFEVMPELDFIKESYYKPTKIYIVTKALTPDLIQDDQIIQPYQILIMCGENELALSQSIFTTIAHNWNYKTNLSDGTFTKFQFTDPVVMSNFNEVKAGYRTILYMTCNLIIMENICDIKELKINNESINILSFNLSYSMSPDTQQMPNKDGSDKYISESIKATSGLSIGINIPLKNDKEFIVDIIETIQELNTGDETYNISFILELMGNNYIISKNMKLISCVLNSAPNQVPSLQVGFIK